MRIRCVRRYVDCGVDCSVDCAVDPWIGKLRAHGASICNFSQPRTFALRTWCGRYEKVVVKISLLAPEARGRMADCVMVY